MNDRDLLTDSYKLPITFLVLIAIVVAGSVSILWNEITDPNHKSHTQLHNEERSNVRNMSCDELKNYILAELNGKYNYYAKTDLAKDLYTWKCEK